MASSNEELHSDSSFLSLTGAGNENTTVPTDGPSDSRCPICLERIRNVAFLNPCFHRFCFACILEWSDRKAECPLCKQRFHSFFHTIRSDTDFEEYIVPLENASYSMCGEQSAANQRSETLPDNGILYGEYSGPQSQDRIRTLDELMRHLGIRRSTHPGGISIGQIREQASLQFRRALYQLGVRVRNVQSGGFYRDISADFFHRNPVRLNRLVPWLKRELRVLCGTHSTLVNNIQHIILNNITIYDLDSQAFSDVIQPHLLHYTNHFLHEFINFARSPFNIRAYDWRASYDVPFPIHDDRFQSYSSFTTSSSEDEEEEGETDNSNENDGEIGETMSSDEEETWDDEVQESTSSSLDHILDDFFLPFGSSDGELVRHEDNVDAFVQDDGHLSTHNGHCPSNKYVQNQLEESAPILGESIPGCKERTEINIAEVQGEDDDDEEEEEEKEEEEEEEEVEEEEEEEEAEDEEEEDEEDEEEAEEEEEEEEEEELAHKQEALRSVDFVDGLSNGPEPGIPNDGEFVSSNHTSNTLQLPSQEQEENSTEQTSLQQHDLVSTKVIHHKGGEIIVIEMLQPETEDILVIEHIEFKTREKDVSVQLLWQGEERAKSAGLQSSTEIPPSGSATKRKSGCFSFIKRP